MSEFGTNGDVAQSPRYKAIRLIKIFLFSASIIPTFLAGALVYNTGLFHTGTFLLVLFGLFIGQAGGDYLYFYFTHFHTDSRDSHTKIFAGWKPLFTGKLINEKNTVWAGIVCLVIDIVIGLYFTYQWGYIIIILALAGGLIAIFFTPLMLRGYKEPVIFVTFGPLCVAGAYFAQTGQLDYHSLLASLPVAFFVTVVAYLKGAKFEVKETDTDCVILNLNTKIIFQLIALGYLSLIILVVSKVLPIWSLLGLLSFPLTFNVVSLLKKKDNNVGDYLWAVVKSLLILVLSGLLISIGILIK